MKIRKNDTVKIMKGKDVGKQGKVLKVLPDEGKIVVEGVNLFKRHVKGDGREKESSIVDIVKPVSVANVMLICQSCGKTTRVGYKIIKGKSVRVCKKCGKEIDGSSEQSKSKISDSKDNKKVKVSKSKKINSKSKKAK